MFWGNALSKKYEEREFREEISKSGFSADYLQTIFFSFSFLFYFACQTFFLSSISCLQYTVIVLSFCFLVYNPLPSRIF